jgi:hypothetical protein
MKCKYKKFQQSDVVTMYLLKKVYREIPPIRCCDDSSFKNGFVEKYLYWFTHNEPYVPYKTMLEKIVGSTSSSSNIYEVIDDNNNCYRSMVIIKYNRNKSWLFIWRFMYRWITKYRNN